jgi:flagellar biosynthesis/type III secretory pathway M-ring protein FliF/YscJ
MQKDQHIVLQLQQKAANSWWILRWILYLIIYVGLMFYLYQNYRRSKKLEKLENERDLNSLFLKEEEQEKAQMKNKDEIESISIKIEQLKSKDLQIRRDIADRRKEYEQEKKTISSIRNWDAYWDVVNSPTKS